jgi:hypothetical protein
MADRRVGVLSHALGGVDRLLEGTAPLTAKPVDVRIGIPHRRWGAACSDWESSPPTRRALSIEWLQGKRGSVEGDRAWLHIRGDVHRRTGASANERRHPVSADQDGLVGLEVEGKHRRLPKARIDALVEVD